MSRFVNDERVYGEEYVRLMLNEDGCKSKNISQDYFDFIWNGEVNEVCEEFGYGIQDLKWV